MRATWACGVKNALRNWSSFCCMTQDLYNGCGADAARYAGCERMPERLIA